MPQWTVAEDGQLLAFLLANLTLKRKDVKNLLKFGAVSINGEVSRQFDDPLKPGDAVTVGDLQSAIAADRLAFAQIQLVYEDNALIVLDKPAGLLTVATANDKTDTLLFRLNAYLKERSSAKGQRAFVVHRLDLDTSGLVMFAKSELVQKRLQEAWLSVEKTYWAVVEKRPQEDSGTITTYLTQSKSLQVYSNLHKTPGSRLARTHWRLLQTRGDLSLLEVRLETGRKHQIRVHMRDIGCRVVGDTRYGAKFSPCHRLGLHAVSLALAHPLTGEPLKFESPLPKVLSRPFTG
jgi:23S rRNA pseudouridine1911/1915/1917 synthase